MEEIVMTKAEMALEIALDYPRCAPHHQLWVVDQMIRALTDCQMIEVQDGRGPEYNYWSYEPNDQYRDWVARVKEETGEDWDEGVPP